AVHEVLVDVHPSSPLELQIISASISVQASISICVTRSHSKGPNLRITLPALPASAFLTKVCERSLPVSGNSMEPEASSIKYDGSAPVIFKIRSMLTPRMLESSSHSLALMLGSVADESWGDAAATAFGTAGAEARTSDEMPCSLDPFLDREIVRR